MSSQRILLVGGLLLFLLSVIYGLVYDGFIMREEQQTLQYNLEMALNMATKGDLTMVSAFAAQFGADNAGRHFQDRIPLHLAIAGAMTSVPLWLTPKLDISERIKRIMALFIVAGGLVLAAGDFLQITVYNSIGFYLVLAGYAWLAVGLMGYLFYAVLYIWLNEEERKPKRG